MTEALKENSPLELYETAYKLHYIDGNIPEACRIYKVIIDEFPSSNECGYAVIQLQKIQANDVADRIKVGGGKGGMVQTLVSVLCALLCIVVTVAVVVGLKKSNAEVEALSLVSQALSMMYAGNDNDALEVLNRAKGLSGGKMNAPYLLSANIYINLQQFSRARAEFDEYQKNSGKTDTVFKKMVSVKAEKEAQPTRTDSTPPSSVQTAPVAETSAQTAAKSAQPEKTPAPPAKPRAKSERTKPVRPAKKSSTGGVPDSVSFF